MTLEKIELFLLKLPYIHYFETSLGRENEKIFILTKVISQGVAGYGEVTASPAPYYSYETTKTAWHVLEEFLIPLVFQEKIEDPEIFSSKVKKYRGHFMAKAGLELALWDLKGKKEGLPLFEIYGGKNKEIPSGVSVGIQETPDELIHRIQAFLEEGYRRVKLKIKPGWDLNLCRKVRGNFPELLLQVDANGVYSPAHQEHLKKLDEFNLLMIEQPYPPYDLWEHSKLQRLLKTPLCLDESIISLESTRSALEMGSCRIINIKVGRVGGIVEAVKIHNYCLKKGVLVWCGGMLESGVGRAHNIHLASLPGFSLPPDLSASSRYFSQDIIDPPIELTPRGTIMVPKGPGIGVNPQEDRIRKQAILRKEYKP
ncbi:MAG: o-succinylbenzoate synthase [Acidobacteriota bacterium]